MSHKWKLNDTYFNFCVKCGTKKSYANKTHKCISSTAYKEKHPHQLIEIIDDNPKWGFLGDKLTKTQCKICELYTHTRYYMNPRHIKFEWIDGIAKVPYITFEKNGIKKAKFVHVPYTYTRIKGSRKFEKSLKAGILWWPIYCLLTPDEACIKDIIL